MIHHVQGKVNNNTHIFMKFGKVVWHILKKEEKRQQHEEHLYDKTNEGDSNARCHGRNDQKLPGERGRKS